MIVADGMSDDGTREILAELASSYDELRIVDNPRNITSHGLNAAIRAARGEIVVRIDAHCRYEPGYVASLAEWLEKSGADNVGGALVPEAGSDTIVGRAMAQCVAHRFGSGNAHHKTARIRKAIEVDTVPFGCFRRSLFEEVGFFREDLARSQ